MHLKCGLNLHFSNDIMKYIFELRIFNIFKSGNRLQMLLTGACYFVVEKNLRNFVYCLERKN